VEIWIYIYIILLGMILGSFLGLVTVRLPLGESLVRPRSHCRYCSHPLAWYENIPILSYLFLLGKCRKCQKRISPKYFIIELVTVGVTLLAYQNLQPWPRFLLYQFLFILPLLALMFLDWEALILPDFLTLPGIAAGFLVHWLDGQYFLPYQFGASTQSLLMESLVGSLAGALSLFFLALIYQKIRNKTGLGAGDIKLGAMIGAFFGWKAVFFIYFLSSFAGILFGIGLILMKRASRDTPIPFGSFLSATSIAFLFYGDVLLKIYLDLFNRLV